jgi:hydroxymethylbilane synthase
LLASAGLARLGMDDVGAVIPADVLLPAPQQGAVGIEVARDAVAAVAAVAAIDHAPTSAAVRIERALLVALGGTCQSPVAALAQPEGAQFRLRAQIFSSDGTELAEAEALVSGPAEAEAFGRQLLDGAPAAVRVLFGA